MNIETLRKNAEHFAIKMKGLTGDDAQQAIDNYIDAYTDGWNDACRQCAETADVKVEDEYTGGMNSNKLYERVASVDSDTILCNLMDNQ